MFAILTNNQSSAENIPVEILDWKCRSSAIRSVADKNRGHQEMLMTDLPFHMRKRTRLYRQVGNLGLFFQRSNGGDVPARQSCEVERDTSVREKPMADLRDYLAEERTFLAWIRTGIALMGFGLVVIAHFDLFADEPLITQRASGLHPHGPSLWFGTALVAIGVAVNLFSAQRFMRLVGELTRDQFVHRSLSMQGVIVALCLALLGIAMTIYLTLFMAQPPAALHA
jgi:putative membrane protein